MILHELYFVGLGGGVRARGPLADAIARDFGSMERW
jgi:superoxide dismutase, Fe-Mn family